MPSGYRFDRFLLDAGERRLSRDGTPVELNARYLDALALMVREGGKLVSKDRFLDEVWRGVPVTDEALTQCIKTLRRLLGDDAARPRFIETVPKHGYRFIAPVQSDGPEAAPVEPGSVASASPDWLRLLQLAGAGTAGGGLAGVIGGLFYGFAGASQPAAPGMGAVSILLVLLCVTAFVALIGAAGVTFGIVAAAIGSDLFWRRAVIGGALGGLVVGAVVKLLGLDAFALLVGRAPGDITGAAEGAVLGGAVGLGGWLASRTSASPRRSAGLAALVGGGAGLAITLAGGRLMGGSLHLLATSFPGSRFRLDQIGQVFGEREFGPISQVVTGTLEGGLFAACIVGAIRLAQAAAPVR